MIISSNRFIGVSRCRCLLLLALPLYGGSALLSAESAGILTGVVIDGTTGNYLEGAEVAVQGTSAAASTLREGRFTLRGVPAGPATLTINYPGFGEKRETVTVAAGETSTIIVRLTGTEVVRLGEFRVASAREGMSQAIALQKAADNAMMVAASDQFGDMAEGGNAAEYLKFLPGIGVDYANNEARAISLRGLSSAFTTVTFDGNPVASASSSNLDRTFEFEQVAVDNVETVEVFKTLLPDQPATSTGGAVNLVGRSALDREGSRLSYRAYIAATSGHLYLKKTPGWGQERTGKLLPGLHLNYSSRLRENLGINLTFSDSQRYTDMPRSEYIYQYNPANGGLPDNPFPSTWHLLLEQKNTNRQSASGKVDWRLAPETKVSVHAQWNWFDMLFSQWDLRLLPGNLNALAIGQAPAYGGGTVNGVAGRGSVQRNQIQSWKHGTTYTAGVDFAHKFTGDAALKASYYWSQSYNKYRSASEGYYSNFNTSRTSLTVGFDHVGATVPGYRVTDSTGAAVDLNDVSRFSVAGMTHNNRTGVDTRHGVNADYTFALKTRLPVTAKLGARRDETTRNIERLFYARPAGSPAITGANLTALVDPLWSGRPLGLGVPGYTWYSAYAAYSQYGPMPSTPASNIITRTEETTDATFARLDVRPLDKLLVVGGARWETSKSDNLDRGLGVRGKFGYEGLFPSLNLKYTPARSLVFRLGASQSIGLPSYTDLRPTGYSVTDPNETTGARGQVNIFNPNLDTYDVYSYDLSVEYYFRAAGFVSASIFRKEFHNFIVSATQPLTRENAALVGLDASTLPFSLDRYNLSYRFNVREPGGYDGIELAYAQTLSFLPKPFDALGIQANYTLLGIEGIKTKQVLDPLDTALDASVREQVKMALDLRAVKQQANLIVNYRYKRLNTIVSLNYAGRALQTITRQTIRFAGTPANAYINELIYAAPRALVDARLDYRWNSRFTPYIQVRNLLNRPIKYTALGLPRHHTEFGDPMYEFGIRGTW